MHFYRFHIGDYRKDTGHLTLLEHGIYRALLDTYYLEERPLCDDIAKLMRTHGVRMDDEQKAFENVLNDFFFLTENGYEHKKCNEQLLEIYAKSQKASDSAKARWNMEKSKNTAESNTCENSDMRTQCERNTNASKNDAIGMLPITHNPLPNKTTKEKKPPSADSDFELMWTEYPKRPGANKSATLKAWNARIKDGADPKAMIQGAKNYAEYCRLNRTDPQFIKQAATFFGVAKHYECDWGGVAQLEQEKPQVQVKTKWHETPEGFITKGKELGIEQGRAEMFYDFQNRVMDEYKRVTNAA